MLEDVLRQHDIPFLCKKVLGAGFAMKVGPQLERYRFYVPYDRLAQARCIVEELFSEK